MQVEILRKRPFVIVITIDAPIHHRFMRYELNGGKVSISDFAIADSSIQCMNWPMGLARLADLYIQNTFTRKGLMIHLAGLALDSSEHVRPTWHTYFIQLCALAARRSNCMKRRVGALIVVDSRVIATG